MILYANYQDLLFSYNFVGGAGKIDVSNDSMSSDVRADITQNSNDDWVFYYMTLSSKSDLDNLAYYPSNHLAYTQLPENDDPSLSNIQITAIQNALHTSLTDSYSVSFEDVAKVLFDNTGTTATADIVFGASSDPEYPGSAGYELDYSTEATAPQHGDIWLNNDAVATWDSSGEGTLAHLAAMHEISHALGIDIYRPENRVDPTKNYQSDPNKPNYNPLTSSASEFDSMKYTVTSYEKILNMDPTGTNNEVMPFGLQLLDIAAIQEIYGINWTTRNENNTQYSKVTAFLSGRPNDAFIYTIWDGGGIGDTIDTSDYTVKAYIDLRQGNFSSIGLAADSTYQYAESDHYSNFSFATGQAKENVAIAYKTIIENATGTDYDDVIIGNAWNNVLLGGDGADKIYGDGLVAPGADPGITDEFTYGPNNVAAAADDSGDDTLDGGEGNDELYGGNGNDTLIGGEGNDSLDGNAGMADTADYSGDAADGGTGAITAIVKGDGTATVTDGWGDTDTLVGVEIIKASAGSNDTLQKSDDTYLYLDRNGTDWEVRAGSSASSYSTFTLRDFEPLITLTEHDDYVHFASVGDAPANLDGLDGTDTIDFSSKSLITTNITFAQEIEFGVQVYADYPLRTYSFNDISTYEESTGIVYGDDGSQFSPVYFENVVVSRVVLDQSQSSLVDVTASIMDFSAYKSSQVFNYDDTFNTYGTENTYLAASSVAGTDYGDTYYLSHAYIKNNFFSDDDPNIGGGSTFTYSSDIHTGAGNDTIYFPEHSVEGEPPIWQQSEIEVRELTIHYRGGNDTYYVDERLGGIQLDPAIKSGDVTFAKLYYEKGFLARFYIDGPGVHNGTLDVYFDNSTHQTKNDNLYISTGNGAFTINASTSNGVLGTGNGTLEDVQATWWSERWEAADGSGETFDGFGGNDVIVGGSGNDTLIGGSGDDVIYYGLGGDTVTGGAGNDIFVLQANHASTQITDFDPTQDVLDTRFIDTALDFTDLIFVEQSTNLLVTIDGVNPFVTLLDTTEASVGASNFSFHDDTPVAEPETFEPPELIYPSSSYTTVNGNSYSETMNYSSFNFNLDIYGLGGNDNIYGGTAQNILNGGTGADNLYGNFNTDIFRGGGAPDSSSGDTADGEYGDDIYELFLGDWSDSAMYSHLSITDVDGVDFIVVPNAFTTDDIYLYELSGTWYLEASIEGYDDHAEADFQIGQYSEGSGTSGIEFVVVQDVVYELDYIKDGTWGVRPPVSGFDPNKNPILNDDNFTGYENTALYGNVLAKNGNGLDYDPDGSLMTVTAQDRYILGLGNFELFEDGRFELVPLANTVASDVEVEYEVIDSDGFISTATISFTIEAMDDYIIGNLDGSTLNGGFGTNTISYETAAEGVTIDLKNNYSFGLSTGDTLLNFTNVVGSDFSDFISPGSNNAVIDGGDGNDVVNYIDLTTSVEVDLGSQTADRGRDASVEDTFTSIEGTYGSNQADKLIGSAGDNLLHGRGGDDEILSGDGDDTLGGDAGDDILNGGSGSDTVWMASGATGGVLNLSSSSWLYDGTNTLAALSLIDGYGDTDTLISIENAFGSLYADKMLGSDESNVLDGFLGNDEIDGGAGNDTLIGGAGDDVLNGGSGNDTASYAGASGAVTVNLATGVSSGAHGSDTLTNIENLTGSDHADTLIGDAGNNIIQGGAENDTIDGGAGIDTLNFANVSAGIDVILSNNIVYDDGEGGVDSVQNVENINGSAYADSITGDANDNVLSGNAGDDLLVGGLGNDTLDGGEGIDTIDYSGNTQGAIINLFGGFTDEDGDTVADDILINIENVIGTNYADQITGNDAVNMIWGNGGNDYIVGNEMDDVLYGGDGDDTLFGKGGDDTLYGGAGNDLLRGDGGQDYLDGGDGNDDIRGGDDSDTIFGGGGDDYIKGQGGDDAIDGGNGLNIIEGNDGNDIIRGGDDHDTLYGNADDDTLYSSLGHDDYFGGTGADTVVFESANSFDTFDEVHGFSILEGDGLDVSDILEVGGYEHGIDTLSDWVEITESTAHSYLRVDRDGAGTVHSFETIAKIVSVTGLADEAALVANGHLIAA